MKVVDDEIRNSIDFESWGQWSRSTLALCMWNTLGTKQTTASVESLSNFICKLWRRGRTLLILSHRVKCQAQLWHSICETLKGTIKVTIFPLISLSNFKGKLLVMREWTLLIVDYGVKGQCQLLHSAFENSYGHNTDYSFVQSLSNFTCKLWITRAGTILSLGLKSYGIKGQVQHWHSACETL